MAPGVPLKFGVVSVCPCCLRDNLRRAHTGLCECLHVIIVSDSPEEQEWTEFGTIWWGNYFYVRHPANKYIAPFHSHTAYPRLLHTPNFLHVHTDCASLGTSKERETERDDRGWSDRERKKMKRKRVRCFVNKVQSNIKKPLSIASSIFHLKRTPKPLRRLE